MDARVLQTELSQLRVNGFGKLLTVSENTVEDCVESELNTCNVIGSRFEKQFALLRTEKLIAPIEEAVHDQAIKNVDKERNNISHIGSRLLGGGRRVEEIGKIHKLKIPHASPKQRVLWELLQFVQPRVELLLQASTHADSISDTALAIDADDPLHQLDRKGDGIENHRLLDNVLCNYGVPFLVFILASDDTPETRPNTI